MAPYIETALYIASSETSRTGLGRTMPMYSPLLRGLHLFTRSLRMKVGGFWPEIKDESDPIAKDVNENTKVGDA